MNLVKGDGDSAHKHKEFYDEYLAVMDLSAEFYLQTVDTVFVRHALPKGEMTHRGRPVDPSRIKRTALLTIEGEFDDISGVGQTEAAHRLCPNIPPHRHAHWLQQGVGHYGVFNGSRFRSEIAPRISDFVLSMREVEPGLAQWRRQASRGQRRRGAYRVSGIACRNTRALSPSYLRCGMMLRFMRSMPFAAILHSCRVGVTSPCAQHWAQRALLYRRPSEPQTIEIAFDGSVYPVRLRRHRQARRYTLRIQATTREVILTIPPRGTVKEAAAFAQKHGGWIAARLGRLPEAAPFADGVVLPLRGVPHRITHRGGARGTVWTESRRRRRSAVMRRRPSSAYRSAHRRFPAPRSQARPASREPALRRANSGLAFQRVTVRDQSSRWGSCSTTGVLSFSWRLILAPSQVLDYLAAHEVAHLIEMNHSREILAAGAAHLPGSRTRQGLARCARRRSASLRFARIIFLKSGAR